MWRTLRRALKNVQGYEKHEPQTYTPPTLSDDVFNVPYSGRTLTVEVPEQVVNAYNIVKRIMQYAGETFSMDDFIKNDK